MKVSEIYQKTINAEYYYRRQNHCPLLGLDDLKKAIEEAGQIEYDMSYAEPSWEPSWFADRLMPESFERRLQYLDDLTFIMRKHRGKLFIAGGLVTDMIIMDYQEWVEIFNSVDVDIFIVEESAEKAEELLMSVMDDLGELVNHIRTSQQVTSFTLGGMYEIQIIRRVYRSPDQILMKFDNWACQYLWSPSTGLQMTPMGLAAYVMRAFPEDCSMHSLSVDYRREKYCNKKGFKVLFPGVPKGAVIECLGGQDTNIVLNTVRRELFPQEQDLWPPEDLVTQMPAGNPWDTDRHQVAGLRPAEERQGMWPDGSTQTYWSSSEHIPGEPLRVAEKKFAVYKIHPIYDSESDYGENRGYMNTWNLLAGRLHNICIELQFYSTLTEVSERDFIEQVFGRYQAPEGMHNINVGVAIRLFTKIPTEYITWAAQYYVHRNLDSARQVWNRMLKMHIGPVIELFSNPIKMWKVDDPGSQSFGQVHPKPISPLEFYGELYKPTFAGIHPAVHLLVDRMMCHVYHVPKDVRHLIMQYVLKAQSEMI